MSIKYWTAFSIATLSCFHISAIITHASATTADEIRYEATLENKTSIGRPLPLAAHWNPGVISGGFDPDYQMQMIQGGHYIFPSFFLAGPKGRRIDEKYYEAAIKRAATLKLPIAFLSTQWEHLLTDDPAYSDLPPSDNPNVVKQNGEIEPKVSPFGPVRTWQEVGRRWTSSPILKNIQEWYPDPPLVLFVSNNEHHKLHVTEVNKSVRYIELYGKNRSNTFKAKVVGDGWIERYRALQNGMREGLMEPHWRNKTIFVGYNAFFYSGNFGRSHGWLRNSLYHPTRFQPWPLAWDGSSLSYYVRYYNDSTDYMLWSPQIQSMNRIFMLDEAYEINPDYWFELSTWDGDKQQREFYTKRGQFYGPDRYGGMVQFGMWLMRPRVVREFRLWNDTVENAERYFLSVVDAVDRVHLDKTLQKFWRHGELVANKNRQHPYDAAIPAKYEAVDRWYLLDTSLDPEWPWDSKTEIPVFSLALVTGKAPEREWLVYAYAPLDHKANVEVTLPNYGNIQVDVSPSGNYYHIKEATRETLAVISPSH